MVLPCYISSMDALRLFAMTGLAGFAKVADLGLPGTLRVR
jgi:hypothetical protein